MVPVVLGTGDREEYRDCREKYRRQCSPPPSRGHEGHRIPYPERKIESIFDRSGLGLSCKHRNSSREHRQRRSENRCIGLGRGAGEGYRGKYERSHESEGRPCAERVAKQKKSALRIAEPTG